MTLYDVIVILMVGAACASAGYIAGYHIGWQESAQSVAESLAKINDSILKVREAQRDEMEM